MLTKEEQKRVLVNLMRLQDNVVKRGISEKVMDKIQELIKQKEELIHYLGRDKFLELCKEVDDEFKKQGE